MPHDHECAVPPTEGVTFFILSNAVSFVPLTSSDVVHRERIYLFFSLTREQDGMGRVYYSIDGKFGTRTASSFVPYFLLRTPVPTLVHLIPSFLMWKPEGLGGDW